LLERLGKRNLTMKLFFDVWNRLEVMFEAEERVERIEEVIPHSNFLSVDVVQVEVDSVTRKLLYLLTWREMNHYLCVHRLE